MKSPKLWLAVLMSLLFGVAAKDGCQDSTRIARSEGQTVIKNAAGTHNLGTAQKFTFENHDYILITFTGEGGGALAHSESCICRPTPKVEKTK